MAAVHKIEKITIDELEKLKDDMEMAKRAYHIARLKIKIGQNARDIQKFFVSFFIKLEKLLKRFNLSHIISIESMRDMFNLVNYNEMFERFFDIMESMMNIIKNEFKNAVTPFKKLYSQTTL